VLLPLEKPPAEDLADPELDVELAE
ncbi:MAG: hypothetical protein QOD02_4165, partial [Mycobacterium sp.]|nr:hypothetical protein [Mycobacterium sp.]